MDNNFISELIDCLQGEVEIDLNQKTRLLNAFSSDYSFTFLDIEGSFTGKQRALNGFLVDLDGDLIEGSDYLWEIGKDVYAAIIENSEFYDDTLDRDSLKFLHDVWLKIEVQAADSWGPLIEIMRNTLKRKSQSHGFQDVRGKFFNLKDFEYLTFIDKAMLIDSLIIQHKVLDESDFPLLQRGYYFFYCIDIMLKSENHLENGIDYESMHIKSIDALQMSINRLLLFQKKMSERSKQAAKRKHELHSQPQKEKIKEWYARFGESYKTINKAAEDAAFKLDIPFSSARNEISKLRKLKPNK